MDRTGARRILVETVRPRQMTTVWSPEKHEINYLQSIGDHTVVIADHGRWRL
jgi:hypothetical protein